MTSELDRLQLALPKRYTLLRELDRGGMSRVYLAREAMPDREVAIKVFDEKLSAQLGRERFLREVELTSQLGHPYIVPIHSAGDAEGALYYVMPFVRGESLRDRLEREGRLPIEDALRITEQVAGALAYAHEKGVIHRDIKPANVLFHAGHAVVADFGIARALRVAETKGTLTHAGTSLGTPDYMSPEQITGEGEVNERSDIYAMACVLYEMLGGQPPFHSRTRQATLARHLADTMPSLRGLRESVPKEVEDAIRRALSKAPVDRFATATDFVRALRQPPGQPAHASATPAGSGDEDQSSVRRWGLAAALSLATVIGIAWVVGTGRDGPTAIADAPDQIRVAMLPPVNRTDDPSLDTKALSLAEEVTAQLIQLPSIRPIGPNTVRWYQGLELSPSQMLDSLDAEVLLESTMELRNGLLQVRVWETDTLLNTGPPLTLPPIPPASFDSALTYFARDIAESFLERHGLSARFTSARSTYGPGRDEWVAGDAQMALRTAESLPSALAHFREAIRLGPTSALYYASLSRAYALSLTYRYDIGEEPYSIGARALAAADSAIALDPALADGHSARGYARILMEIDLDGAVQDFATAGELAPNDAEQLSWSARVLGVRGAVEAALDSARRAVDLDAGETGRHMALAPLAIQAGRYDEAIDAARVARRLSPTLARAAWREAVALVLSGRANECLELDLGAYELIQAVCLRRAGQEGAAQEMVAEAEARLAAGEQLTAGYLNDLPADALAAYYADLGDAVDAARWLTETYRTSPVGVDAYLLRSALFAPVADDPVFVNAVERAREGARARLAASGAPLQ